MFSKICIASLLFVSSLVSAQSATPAATVSQGQSSATATPSSVNPVNLVNALLPSASVTSLSPAQESKLAADASAYFVAYTQSNPIAKLEADVFVNQLLGGKSDPTPEQSSYIIGLLGEAQTAVIANPTAYVASIQSAVAPFAFAVPVSTYAENLIQGLRTVVASDLSLPIPTQSSRAAAAPRAALPTGVMGVAAAAAAGAVGAALL